MQNYAQTNYNGQRQITFLMAVRFFRNKKKTLKQKNLSDRERESSNVKSELTSHNRKFEVGSVLLLCDRIAEACRIDSPEKFVHNCGKATFMTVCIIQ